MASAYMYVSPRARDAYIGAYERALLGALGEILASIPPEQLAIQWDVCQEVLIYESFFPDRPADYKNRITASWPGSGRRSRTRSRWAITSATGHRPTSTW